MKKEYDYEHTAHLVSKAQLGDKKAKDELCQRFRPLVYGLTRTAYETIDHEDMAQVLWIVFLESLADYDSSRGLPFAAYVKKRLSQAAVDYMRRHEVMLKHGGVKDEETKDRLLSGEIMVDGVRQNWYEMKQDELTEGEVEQLIAGLGLTSRQEEILHLRMKGHSWADIHGICHLSYKNVHKHKQNIRAIVMKNEIFRNYFA